MNLITVEITLEFESRPDKADVYNLLAALMEQNCLRYDIDGELDSQEAERNEP